MKTMDSFNRGFSLLEVVVAATVLGFSLVAAYQVLGTGLRAAAAAEQQAKALVIADGLSVQLGSVLPLEDGTRSGRASNGFGWAVEISPYTEDVVEEGRRLEVPDAPAELKQIRIEVSGSRGVLLEMNTLRLKVAQHER